MHGCGQCVDACHEGAIAMVDGKAKLVNNTAYGWETASASTLWGHHSRSASKSPMTRKRCGDKVFPAAVRSMARDFEEGLHRRGQKAAAGPFPGKLAGFRSVSCRDAPYLKNAELMVAADCTPLALPEFHRVFLVGGEKVCLMGCPKLDDAQEYAEKLTDIIRENRIASVTEVRMEVPCCSGLTRILEKACADAGRGVSLKVFTVGVQGGIVDKETIRFTHG